MYPFSDRLFLYMVPGIYLIIGIGIEQFNRQISNGWNQRLIQYLSLIIPLCAIVFYFTYLPKKSNDIYSLIEFLKSTNNTITFTPYAEQRTLKWLEFTKYYDQDNSKHIQFKEKGKVDGGLENLLITIQSKKFGHRIKYSTPEPEIIQLIEQDKIFLYHRIDGFAIYKYK